MSGDDLAPYAIVVDDDQAILLHAIEMLEEVGFCTLTALNADEAIAGMEAHGTDVALLFTDVEMPGGMDGFALARTVAARWPAVGILVASGNLQPAEGELPVGAVFVAKPFSAEVVHQRVHALLPDGRKPEPLRRRMG